MDKALINRKPGKEKATVILARSTVPEQWDDVAKNLNTVTERNIPSFDSAEDVLVVRATNRTSAMDVVTFENSLRG